MKRKIQVLLEGIWRDSEFINLRKGDRWRRTGEPECEFTVLEEPVHGPAGVDLRVEVHRIRMVLERLER